MKLCSVLLSSITPTNQRAALSGSIDLYFDKKQEVTEKAFTKTGVIQWLNS